MPTADVDGTRSPTRSSATRAALGAHARRAVHQGRARHAGAGRGARRATGQRVLDLGPAQHRRVRRVLHRARRSPTMQADALAGLLRTLDLAPGRRSSAARAARACRCSPRRNHPDVAPRARDGVDLGRRRTGCCSSRSSTAASRSAPRGRTAWRRWSSCPSGPRCSSATRGNRDRFLALDPRRVHRDARAVDARVLPGPELDRARPHRRRARARLTVPTLVFRSGASDPHHTRATSERLHALIPGSQLVEPPWGDDEWNEQSKPRRNGTGALFERRPVLEHRRRMKRRTQPTIACSLLGEAERKRLAANGLGFQPVPRRLCCQVYQWAYGLPVGGYRHFHTEMKTVVNDFHKANLAVLNHGPNAVTPASAAHAVNELIKPASVIATHVNEGATSDGKVKATSHTAAFMKLSKHPVYVALSGRMMEFDGSGKCVAG